MGLLPRHGGIPPQTVTTNEARNMSPDPSSHTSSEVFDPAEQAERCRRLARTVTDQRTLDTLHELASEYEERARGNAGA